LAVAQGKIEAGQTLQKNKHRCRHNDRANCYRCDQFTDKELNCLPLRRDFLVPAPSAIPAAAAEKQH
jgi:hypothetical protein